MWNRLSKIIGYLPGSAMIITLTAVACVADIIAGLAVWVWTGNWNMPTMKYISFPIVQWFVNLYSGSK